MKNLNGNEDYDLICNHLVKEMERNDRLFNFYPNEKIDCFIGKNEIVAKFEP